MEIILIVLGIWILYSRTWLAKDRAYYIIDDIVPMKNYLYVVPNDSPPANFYSSHPPKWMHIELILIHSLNVVWLNVLFGWKVALLFAFNPLAVNGTAWITGGYYAKTTFLTLTAFYFVHTFQNVFGALAGSLFYVAALNSTIVSIAFPFLFLVVSSPWGLIFFWPLLTYLFGNRFKCGFKIRNYVKKDKLHWRKPIVMVKVVAYYLGLALWPNKLAFFRNYGSKYGRTVDSNKKEIESANEEFYRSLLAIFCFAYIGWQLSPIGTVIFFVGIGPFSQFKVLGQFIAERYLYLPSIGICMILASFIGDNNVLLAIVATAYAYRSHLYIPAFHDIESLYKNGIKNYPDSVSNLCNLGERWLHIGEPLKAQRIFLEALTIEPMSFLAHVNLAAYWIYVKNFQAALHYTEEAIKYADDPKWATLILNKQRSQLQETVNKMREQNELKNVHERIHAGQEEAVAQAV